MRLFAPQTGASRQEGFYQGDMQRRHSGQIPKRGGIAEGEAPAHAQRYALEDALETFPESCAPEEPPADQQYKWEG